MHLNHVPEPHLNHAPESELCRSFHPLDAIQTCSLDKCYLNFQFSAIKEPVRSVCSRMTHALGSSSKGSVEPIGKLQPVRLRVARLRRFNNLVYAPDNLVQLQEIE